MHPLRLSSFVMCCVSLICAAHARLGENEAQSQARYGAPAPELIGPAEKPLLEGAKEVIYNFQGWRVRAAFLTGVTVRVEYAHIPENGALKQISDDETKAILDAEKGNFAWREQKPRTGYKELNALKTLFEGRQWERSDHAEATLKGNLLLVLQMREAEAHEKRLAKQPRATPTRKADTPKF